MMEDSPSDSDSYIERPPSKRRKLSKATIRHTKMEPDPRKVKNRRCFVTVGATAGFRQLLEEVAKPTFLAALAEMGYGALDVQCGPDHAWFEAKLNEIQDADKHGIKITAFALTSDMRVHMLACRGVRGQQLPGAIISHAGTGTILEAGRYAVPLIVVPNPTLADNHQEELAEAVAEQKWGVHGRIDDLPTALVKSWDLVEQGQLYNLPPYSDPPFPVPESERITIFDWMVLTCYPEEYERQQRILDDGLAHAFEPTESMFGDDEDSRLEMD